MGETVSAVQTLRTPEQYLEGLRDGREVYYARDYAGYQGVLAVHAEGSIEAEKLLIYRSYDPTPAVALARQLAGLDPGSTA